LEAITIAKIYGLALNADLNCDRRFEKVEVWREATTVSRKKGVRDRMRTAIEYGVPTNRCGLQLRLGIEKGFFRDENIDLHVRVVFGGPEIACEFDSGRLPIGELGTPPGLTALAKGARFKIIGSGVRRGAVQYFVVHPRFSQWHELRGARLGVLSPGSCSDWYMRKVLKQRGMDPQADVTICGLGSRYAAILELLAANSLDGAILSEPHVAMGEAAGLFKVWLGMNKLDFVPRMQWTIAVANDAILANQADLVAAALRGCRRSYRYAADNRDEWADFGAHYFNISRDTMTRSIEREFEDLHFDCAVDVEGLEAAVALQRELGAVTTPVALNDIVDNRFVCLAAPRQTRS
jgi:ABC-type nitrate/sulfonate/bicarbonate transport system substrate-binding protein